jgi:hypothetical protein
LKSKYGYNNIHTVSSNVNCWAANLPEAGVAAAAAVNIKGNENFISFYSAVERYSQTVEALWPANNSLINSR